MAFQKNINTIIFVAVISLACIFAAVQAATFPVANIEAERTSDAAAAREGRFYGMGGSQSTAFASANAASTGLGGYPYGGGGLGIASATAISQAGAGGYPYGK